MGTSFERPTADDLQQMEDLVEEAMQQGALGLSSQVMMPPGSLATTEDIIQLAKVAARHGGLYSTHIRNEGTGVFESVKEAIEIGEKAGLPVDVIHLKIADQQYWGRMNEVVALIEDARKRGVNVQANVYPYTRGNNNLVSIIPPWAHEGGTAELLKRLKDSQPALEAQTRHQRRPARLVQPLHRRRQGLVANAHKREQHLQRPDDGPRDGDSPEEQTRRRPAR